MKRHTPSTSQTAAELRCVSQGGKCGKLVGFVVIEGQGESERVSIKLFARRDPSSVRGVRWRHDTLVGDNEEYGALWSPGMWAFNCSVCGPGVVAEADIDAAVAKWRQTRETVTVHFHPHIPR